MTFEEQAAVLEKVCDEFITSYENALPRIARRGFQPILDELEKLVGMVGTGKAVDIAVFAYPVTGEGLRSSQPTGLWGVISWNKEKKGFGYAMRAIAHPSPNSVIVVGLPGTREVTMEDIVELNVKPSEMAQHLKNLAASIEFQKAFEQTTQPMAKA
jgi:hypothetical protein